MATFYFLVPTVQTTMPDGNTVAAPEYLSTDLKGLTWSAISFGAEGLDLLTLASPNTALSAEPDVFTFPVNLTAALTDTDVTNLSNYLTTYNVPTSQLAAGQVWTAVLRQIAQIFLVAQQASAQNGGQSLFTLNATLKVGKPTPSAAIAATPPGVFNFANADPEASVADTLLAVSAQFTGPIHVNGGTL